MKIRGLKYGAVVVAGIMLCTAPLTAWAEKAAEAVETSAAEETEETKAEEVKETEAETKAEEAKAEETKAETEETKAEEATTEETKETEEIADGEVVVDDETAKTETKAEEAKTEEEITDEAVATESDAEIKNGIASEVLGTWYADEEAGMRYEEDGTGALLLTDTSYAFTYVVDGDQLILDFESEKVVDCRYTASVAGDVLTLIGGEGTVGGTYELAKN